MTKIYVLGIAANYWTSVEYTTGVIPAPDPDAGCTTAADCAADGLTWKPEGLTPIPLTEAHISLSAGFTSVNLAQTPDTRLCFKVAGKTFVDDDCTVNSINALCDVPINNVPADLPDYMGNELVCPEPTLDGMYDLVISTEQLEKPYCAGNKIKIECDTSDGTWNKFLNNPAEDTFYANCGDSLTFELPDPLPWVQSTAC